MNRFPLLFVRKVNAMTVSAASEEGRNLSVLWGCRCQPVLCHLSKDAFEQIYIYVDRNLLVPKFSDSRSAMFSSACILLKSRSANRGQEAG